MRKLISVWFASLCLFASTCASAVVIDFDAAATGTFITSPFSEDGFTITVNSGHYDIFGDLGDNSFNLDHFELGLSSVTLTKDGGGLFDVLSFDVTSSLPSMSTQFTIAAVGNTGNIFAPTSPGVFNFGAGFQGVSALTITQNSPGFFSFDDLTLGSVSVPEPGTIALISFGLAGLGFARRKKA